MARWIDCRIGLCEAAKALMRDRSGSSAAEFAMVFPLLGLVLFGIIWFSIAFHDRVVLTDGVRIAARQMAISRGQTNPYTKARGYFQGSTGWDPADADQATVTISIAPSDGVTPTECTDATGTANCALLLSGSVGGIVTVNAKRDCLLNFFGYFYGDDCEISSRSSERVQ